MQEVLGERDALCDEIVQLRSQVAESAANLNTNRDSPTSEDTLPPEPANQTLNLLSSLQTNFNALQVCLVGVGMVVQWVWLVVVIGTVCGGDD